MTGLDCEVRVPALFRCVHWGIFLALAAFLLFAHGCHGDEDTELSALIDRSRDRETDPR